MTLLACEMSAIVWWLAHSLVVPFLGIGMRIDLFQYCGHCCIFQICWHNKCRTLVAPSFRDVNNSAGISLHPLALLVAVLLKTYWISHVWLRVTNYTIVVMQIIKIFFHTVLPYNLSIPSWSLQHLVGLYHFYPLLCPSLGGMLPWCFQFSWRDL